MTKEFNLGLLYCWKVNSATNAGMALSLCLANPMIELPKLGGESALYDAKDLFGNPLSTDLFGNVVSKKKSKKGKRG
jgi:hypothetical protein